MAPFLALTQQRPRDHCEQVVGGTQPGGLLPWGWRVALGIQRRKGLGGWGSPGEEASLHGELLSPRHWPSWGDGAATEEEVGCWGGGGLSTSLQLLWPLGNRDRYCPGPGWFQLAAHTLAALHSVGGTLVSVAGATMPAPGSAWPSISRGQGSPGPSWVVKSGLQGHLLPQACPRAWALPGRAAVVPGGGQLGEGASVGAVLGPLGPPGPGC